MTEKSIAQIVAEIKVKIPDIDVQLSAIEVGELSEITNSTWQMVCESAQQLSMVVEGLSEKSIDHQTSYDLREPTVRIISGLTALIIVKKYSDEFSSDALVQMQIVLQNSQSLLATMAS